jgi:Ca-activated chloride channel family protein
MDLDRRATHSRFACIIAGVMMLFAFAAPIFAQERCLQPGKIDDIRKKLASAEEPPLDGALGEELFQASNKLRELARAGAAETTAGGKARAEFDTLAATWAKRICSILNTNGWPRRASVGRDGAEGFMYIIQRTVPLAQQLELYPIVSDAYMKGDIEGSDILASYVDRLRLAIGRKQLYGTQAFVRDGFLVMAPIENISEVDKRRANFGLQPQRTYERTLEVSYRLPLIRTVTEPSLPTVQGRETQAAATSNKLGNLDEEAAVINVETAFVSLDVIVPDAVASGSASLDRSDFQLFDAGKEIEIETFAKAETPFDIVLLLDLSGSTSDKVGLIKKSTRRFIEMKRSNDRVSVVAFDDTQRIVSELEADKAILLDRIKKIEGRGGSAIWDAVKFGLDMLGQRSEGGRRKAIVLMSDGVDNQLAFYPTITKKMGFADLVEAVQRSNAAIFPIYLDTEDDNPGPRRAYEQARQTLSYLAEQSAGNIYTARKLDDLADIYDRVLKDVGTVYTLGFTPDVESGSSEWRELKVEIPSRPNLKIKHRPGYLTR